MDSQQLRALSGNFGAMRAFATIIVVVVMATLIPSGEVSAAHGECRWEGGPGVSGGYAYCAAEDCIGNGGLAQCSAGDAVPAAPFTPEQGGPGGWVNYMCHEGPAYMWKSARWCKSAGGQWVALHNPPICVNLPPDILGSAGAITNDADRAVSISDTWVGSSCGAPVDTDWGIAVESGFCWSGSTETELGITTRELRRRYYPDGPSCSETTTITLQRLREARCPVGYKRRNAIDGPECYIPAECSETCAGNPVSVVTGTKFEREDDYQVAADTGIEFSRFYKSTGYYWPEGLVETGVTGEFMATDVWRHTYDRRFYSVSGNAEVGAVLQRASGALQVFDTVGVELTNRTSSGAILRDIPNTGWDLTLSNGDIEHYDTSGRLTSITTRAGRVTTLSYTGDLLTTVTGPFGHTLTLAYNADDLLESVTLPDTGMIQYGYDDSKRMTSVTYPDGNSRQYRYEHATHAFLLTAIVDESGTVFATYQYDDEGRVISESHAGNVETYSFSYAPDGQSTSVTDPLGTTTDYGLAVAAGMKRPASHSQPCMGCGSWSNTTYDTNGNPATRTDYNGDQTVYSYDATRNLQLSRTEAYGTPRERSITTVWHPTFRLPTRVTEPGRETTYTHDTNGNVLTVTITDTATSDARTWTYTYNTDGQVLTIDGPQAGASDLLTLGYSTCTTGAGCGQIATITDAANHQTSILSYDTNGLPLTIRDPNGTVTTLSYDARQRLVSRTVGSETTTIDYWPTGLVKKITFPDNSFYAYGYDSAQRLVEVTDAGGNRIAYTLDGAGNRLTEAIYDPLDALTFTRTRVFDGFGRPVEEVGSQGQTVSYTYDDDGNVTSQMDQRGRETIYGYDELDRLVGITDPMFKLTQLGYDANDNLVSVTDPRTLTTTYTYNGLSEQVQLSSPDTGSTSYTRDAAGNLDVATDARGKTADHAYDALGRLTQIVYPDQTVEYTYDQGMNGKGRLTGISDGSVALAWTYDAIGRVTQRAQTVDTVQLDVSYVYDTSGRLSSLTTPSGQVIGYTYSNGRISGITVNQVSLLSQVSYQPFGATTGWQWGNGSATIRQYDTDGQLTYLSSAGTSTYSYYADGLIRSRADDVTISPPLTAGSKTFSMASTSNRVVSASGLLTRSYSYDAAGNTLGDGSRSFTYNDAGRMATATSGGVTTSYVYSGLGERVKKSNTGLTRYFAYDEAGQLLGEYDDTGSLVQETVWLGDIPVATLRPDGLGGVDVYYVHTDHLNTPRRVTRPIDDTVIWRWDSVPFGVTSADEDPDGDLTTFTYNLRFPGQYYDSETGLHYNYFRTYDPSTGRYLESDPIGLAGGLNTFGYVGGNPLSAIDPYGLDACYVLFPDYPITYNSSGDTSTWLGGHAGVLGYDDQGRTRYYEYGRYSRGGEWGRLIGERFSSSAGNVRRVKMPDLEMGDDGKPTPESLERLKEALSDRAGKDTDVELSCDADADENKVYDYIEDLADDANRTPYRWNPFRPNHCRSVAEDAFNAGR